MVNTVIFDMDGVLINSEPVHQRHEREMYEELGLELSFEEQSPLWACQQWTHGDLLLKNII